MATTTNFGWTTPDDTDLVKDGAAAIRTLGSAIDTSLVDLKGGTTGQVLSKSSNTDMDFTWVAQDDTNAIQNAIMDAKGDLIVATAADTPARLAVGTNGYVLTADSAEATGVKWAAAGSGFVGCRLKQTSGQTISNNTNTAIQWDSEDYDTDSFHDNATNNTRVTIPSGKAGKYLFVGNCFNDTGATSTVGRMASVLYKNGTVVNTSSIENTTSASSYENWTIHTVLDLAENDYIQWYVSHTSGGNGLTTDASFCVSYLGA